MLIKICAWCQCLLGKGNVSQDTPITDTFRTWVQDEGGSFTHGCCVPCLEEMDKAPACQGCPHGDVCSACGEMFCEGDCPQGTVDPDSPEYCPPCKGKHSKEKHMAQFCFIDDPTGHQVPCEHTRKTGSLLERLTRMKVIWDNNTKFDMFGLDS